MGCIFPTKHAVVMHGKKKKEERWVKKRKDVAESTGDNSTKIQLTDSMKQALVIEGNMSAEQATVLCSKIQEN